MTGNDRPCPDDLVARAGRHTLSDLEQRALDAHLESCGPCRAASAVAMLFDTIPETQPEDNQLIARVTARATRVQSRAGWRGLRAAAVVALVVLTGGAAVAAWLGYRAAERPAGAQPPQIERAARAPRRLAAKLAVLPASPAAEEAPVLMAEPPKPSAATERKRPPMARAEGALSPQGNDSETTPASLFAEANSVRRAGEVRKAIGLYQALRQRFPDSEEARLSAISQGDLLLTEGEPAKAIAAYAAYLRAVPRGSLTEEALFGKARGLELLGRSREERETWQELAQRFPRSAYQPAARRRLRELAP
jgi:TolA-binding protein